MPLKPAEIATHPGEWLRKELVEEQKLSVTLVAERLGVTRQAMSNLLNGNVGLSAEMALKIEKTFGVGADPLLRMQATYDLAEARGEDPEAADPQAGGVEYVAAEALEAFQEIADEARRALHDQRTLSVDSLAPTNALTAARAAERLGQLNREIMESHALLAREPAIARVVASDENDHKQVFYIARAAAGSTVSRRYRFASYRAPIGRLAALPPGGFVEFGTGTDRKTYEVIERALFKPLEDVAGWDSVNTVFEGEETRTITVASLRRLLDDALADDSVDEIERILTEAEAEQNIKSGRTRGIITKMQLRDQAVLDAYQDEIFRLPLDSQLVILGPPGTGKTTTLIRRLGQKLDSFALSEEERSLVDVASLPLQHSHSWIMFTPTDLLRQYLKEAFAREGVPAPDQRIKSWDSYRKDIARNYLGILRTGNGGGPFILKDSAETIKRAALDDPIGWYEEFQRAQLHQFWDELSLAAEALSSDNDESVARLGRRLVETLRDARGGAAAPLLYALAGLSSEVRRILSAVRAEIEKQLRSVLTRTQKAQRAMGHDFFAELMAFLDTLEDGAETIEEDIETDDEDEDDEERPATRPAAAQRAFFAALRLQARRRRRTRRGAAGRTAVVLQWIGDRGLEDDEARQLGQRLTLQLALNRFAAPIRRYLLRIPSRYQRFRRLERGGQWYTNGPVGREAHPLEIDLVILGMLRAAGELLADARIRRRLQEPTYDALSPFRDIQRNQILVDEAPDFSPIQLASMRALASAPVNSFFACGDFNQRITEWGSRNEEALKWVEPRIELRRVSISYRQSQQLHDFANRLLTLGGENAPTTELPEDVNNDGVDPVLALGLSGCTSVAGWLALRLIEIERDMCPKPLPSIAVLVHHEDEVRPLADALNEALADQNLKTVACVDGQIIGRDDEIRVFDIRHIKGLEFEAVFFVGIDKLAEAEPNLFERYLYVGATRAATYLGVTCERQLPPSLESLSGIFATHW